MNLSGMIDSLCDAKDRIQDGWRRRILAATIGLCGALFILGAAGFAIASGYIWLCRELPDHQAALVVAVILLFVGCIVIAVARSRARPRVQPAAADAAPDLARQVDDATSRAVREAMSQVRGSPMSAVLTALAAGAVIGLLRPVDDA